MTQYFKTTTIIDDEGNLIATLEDKEVTANEVIVELAKRHDNNVAPTPLLKTKKEKKATKKAKIVSLKPKPTKGKRVITCKNCLEAGHMTKTCPTGAGREAYLKRTAAETKVSPTPTEVGEREIDKDPEMLTLIDYGTIRDEFEQGVNIDMLCLEYPAFDRGEIKRAKGQDSYLAYTLDYERQYKK